MFMCCYGSTHFLLLSLNVMDVHFTFHYLKCTNYTMSTLKHYLLKEKFKNAYYEQSECSYIILVHVL